MLTGLANRRHAGLSLRGMPAVLAGVAASDGLALAVAPVARRNRVSSASETTACKVKGRIDSWKLQFHAHPPTRLDATK